MNIPEKFLKHSATNTMTNSQAKLLEALLEPMVFEKAYPICDTKYIVDSTYEIEFSKYEKIEEKDNEDE